MAMEREGDLPEFPFPFQETGSSWDEKTGVNTPLTRRERLICHVMQSIMRKPGWMKKFHFFVGKWKEELRQATIPKDLDPDYESDSSEDEGSESNASGNDAHESDEEQEKEEDEAKAEPQTATDLEECREAAGGDQQGIQESTHQEEGQAGSVQDASAEAVPGASHEVEEGKALHKVADDVIEYALAELKWLVDTHDGGPVEPSPVQGVFMIPDADKLFEPSGVKRVLLAAVSRMEDVPEDEVDYHPGTNNQVVDLVHPSLFCLYYGKTHLISKPEDEILPWDKLISSVGDHVAQIPEEFITTRRTEFISNKFQWLPAEIDIPSDSHSPARFRSYINNLNPREFPELYPALAEIFDKCFVPLFNSVLTQAVNPRQPRLEVDCHSWYDNWKGDREYNMDDDDDHEEWYRDRQPEQPKVPEFQPPPEVPEDKRIDLRGRRVQVIVKIAEIKLTPDDPVYPGGTWHVEGMKNESIVATGIYYFDSSNIKDSELLFRKAVDEPSYEQNDNKGMWKVYGLRDDSPLIQSLGSVPTDSTALCLAFPNVYHHKVSPFSLLDQSKPGHRKILAFFLVDPGKRIPSTAMVPPQQARWRRLEMERSVHPCSVFPAPALERIIENVCLAADAINDEEVKDFRLHLMMERKMLLDEATEEILERPFSLCEH